MAAFQQRDKRFVRVRRERRDGEGRCGGSFLTMP
jgi:hypothetical protein